MNSSLNSKFLNLFTQNKEELEEEKTLTHKFLWFVNMYIYIYIIKFVKFLFF